MKHKALTGTLFCLAVGFACDRASDDADKVRRAQTEADRKIAGANQDVTNKRAEVTRALDDTQRAAAEAVTAAQAQAKNTIAEAEASFSALREDYRHRVALDLVDVDRRIDLLAAKTDKATMKAQPSLKAHLDRVRTKRNEHQDEITRLEAASATTWDAAKARADTKWAELKSELERAN